MWCWQCRPHRPLRRRPRHPTEPPPGRGTRPAPSRDVTSCWLASTAGGERQLVGAGPEAGPAADRSPQVAWSVSGGGLPGAPHRPPISPGIKSLYPGVPKPNRGGASGAPRVAKLIRPQRAHSAPGTQRRAPRWAARDSARRDPPLRRRRRRRRQFHC